MWCTGGRQTVFLLVQLLALKLTCCGRPNILFIVLDDFRPILRSYGNQLIIAPNMDNLARNSVVFNRAYTQQALCGPSRTSFLTSRRPDTTKLWDVHYYWRKSAGNYTTLPQYFKEHGYHTESFGKIFHPELYSLDEIKLAKFHTKPHGLPSVAWNPWTDLRERDDIKSLNVSFPFGPIPEHFQKLMIQSYYASVSYVDNLLGQVFAALERKGLSENTITLLTGDHGWALGENQEWSKFSNFEVTTRVPLLVSIPRLTGKPLYGPQKYSYKHLPDRTLVQDNQYKTSDGLVELVDIFPSLVELAGLPVLKTCPQMSFNITICTEGCSFVPLIKNATSPHTVIKNWKSAVFSQYPRPSLQPEADSDQPRAVDSRVMGYSIRTDSHRYTEWIQFYPNNFTVNWSNVYARELYSQVTDSEDHHNLASDPQYRDIVHKLAVKLRQGWRAALPLLNQT